MVEGVAFHFRDRQTFLNQANPLTKLAALLCVSFLLVGASLEMTLYLGVILAATALALRLPLGAYLKESLFFLFMAIFIAVTEWLASGNYAQTAAASLRFLAIVLAGMVLSDTTAPDDLSRSLGRVLNYIPFLDGYRIAATIELTLAIIPLIFDVAMQVKVARHARLQRTWRRPVSYLVSYTSSLFTLLLDRMDDLSVALDARAFDPSAPRRTVAFSVRDAVICLAMVVIVGIPTFIGW